MNKRVLVTGGAGFMGSNFVDYLTSKRPTWQLTVLDSLTYAGQIENLSHSIEKVTFIQGDICNSDLVQKLVSKADLVVNFAAETHNDNSLKNPYPFYNTNVMGTVNLLEACRRNDTRFHQISTDEVFGDLPLNSADKFNEETKLNPSSPYSASKAAADQAVLAWFTSFGLRVTISNSANNFGARQFPEKLIPRAISLLRAGEKPKVYGSGLNVRDWIHVDDHSSAVLAIIEEGEIGERYCVSSNQLRTNLQVLAAINQAFGLPDDNFEFVSDRPGHDLKYSSDNSKLRKSTSWAPTKQSLEEWLKFFIDSENF